MKEINVLTLTIFKTTEEIQKSIIMNLWDVSFGTFLMKLNQLKALAANLEWRAKSVMGGWNNAITLLSTTQR